jgi:hypothetical protein
MKSASCCALLFAVGLAAQTPSSDAAVNKLNSTLLPLATLPRVPDGDSFHGTPLRKREKCSGCIRAADYWQFMEISRQIVNDIMSEADRYHRPTFRSVSGFAYALTSVLAGRDLPIDRLSRLTNSIVETLDVATEFAVNRSDAKDQFNASVMQTKKALIDIGVGAPDAQYVAECLALMGSSVWGPHFTPVE